MIMPTDVGWRLYLSCATPNSKHWWIDALDAERPEELPFGDRHLVLPGNLRWAVKDPVIIRDHEGCGCGCAATPSMRPVTRTG